jgi:PAS domain S-box-containing protein
MVVFPSGNLQEQNSALDLWVSLFGGLVLLIGLFGLLGIFLDWPILRTYIPSSPIKMPFYSALGLCFLGLAILTILPRLPEPLPTWRKVIQLLSPLCSGGIGFYFFVSYLIKANFDFLGIVTRPTLGIDIPFIAAISLMLLSSALFLTSLYKHKPSPLTLIYGTNVPALIVLGLVIFAILGHLYSVPVLYNFRFAFPGTLGFGLTSLAVLIGTVRYGGLFQALTVSDRRIKLIAFLGVGLSLAILFQGLIIILEANTNLQQIGQASNPQFNRLYLQLEALTIFLFMLVNTLTLQATFYFDHWLHAIQRELEAQESNRRLIEGVRDYAIFSLESSGYITTWNLGAEKVTGYSDKEVLGRHFSLFFPPEEVMHGKPEQMLQSAKNHGKYEEETLHVRGDGSQFWVNVLITALDDDARKLKGFTVITRDITRQKITEEEIKTYQKRLQRSNQDLEQFAIITSHDLQAPLRKVRMFSEQLMQDAQQSLKPDQMDLLSRIHQSVMKEQSLVSDLLALSKVSQRGHPFKPVDLSVVMGSALANLEDQIRQKHAQVEIGPLPTLEGDETQLVALLQNLVENGLKYQFEGHIPVVKVRAECLDEQYCDIAVEDNGIGFKPEEAERIFKPFERLHGKGSPYPGTGIGLAICKRIAERHGGCIQASSIPGKGSRFTVRLPYKTAEGTERSEVSYSQPECTKLLV